LPQISQIFGPDLDLLAELVGFGLAGPAGLGGTMGWAEVSSCFTGVVGKDLNPSRLD